MSRASDIQWLGYSYLAFRIIHTIRDKLSGRLQNISLQDYVIYVIFFPGVTAGPIDRIQRFLGDLDQSTGLTADRFTVARKARVDRLIQKVCPGRQLIHHCA